jgi:hypothetical protein
MHVANFASGVGGTPDTRIKPPKLTVSHAEPGDIVQYSFEATPDVSAPGDMYLTPGVPEGSNVCFAVQPSLFSMKNCTYSLYEKSTGP